MNERGRDEQTIFKRTARQSTKWQTYNPPIAPLAVIVSLGTVSAILEWKRHTFYAGHTRVRTLTVPAGVM
jgi:hypothetical protein